MFPFRVRALIPAALFAIASVAAQAQSPYSQVNLDSDIPGLALHTDSDLKNPWGMSFSPTGPFWISDNKTGLTTLYNGAGAKQGLIATVPAPPGGSGPSAPTGQVYYGGQGFVVTDGKGKSGASRFLFSTEDGTISGWAPSVNFGTAFVGVNNSVGADHAIYKGLAFGNGQLYAADFHNNRIDVFDDTFAPVALAAGAFKDPNLPAKYAPFNVQAFNDKLYVTYAEQDSDAVDNLKGAGKGFVDVYDEDGNLLTPNTFINRGKLNAPWGVAIAPLNFGALGGALLVGNFGDGTINGYDPITGAFIGTVDDSLGNPLVNDGLWGLSFGNGAAAGALDSLYFTAGPNDEANGLFGVIRAVPEPASALPLLFGMMTAGGLCLRRRKR